MRGDHEEDEARSHYIVAIWKDGASRTGQCQFRRIRPPIPSETVQLFRAKPSTDSEPSRPG